MITLPQDLFIKICGITNLKDAQMACSLKVNAIGFNFSKFSKYYITSEYATFIIEKIPDYVSKIGVFEGGENFNYIKNILKQVPLSAVQLEGNYAPDDLVGFETSVIKAFVVDETFDVEIIKKYLVDAYLLKVKEEKLCWDIAIKAKEYGRVILSRNLDQENVEIALRYVKPYGLDLCESIESKGKGKNPDLMKDLVARARSVELYYEMDENGEEE